MEVAFWRHSDLDGGLLPEGFDGSLGRSPAAVQPIEATPLPYILCHGLQDLWWGDGVPWKNMAGHWLLAR